MLAAAAAWDGIASQLHSAAAGYQSVVTELVSAPWLGPSSSAMAAAAAPFVTWLTGTGAQAEQTAGQARAAAAAYSAAFTMTVPPPVIAANRAQLAALVATNLLGQNTAAIAATEALYLEMWAQDAVAMYGYAAAASVAATLTPFTAPGPTSDPNLSTTTAAGEAARAAGNAAGSLGQTAASQLSPAAAAGSAAPAPAATAPILPPELTALLQLEAATGPPLAASSLSVGSASWNAAAANNRKLIANSEFLMDAQDEMSVMQREMNEILADMRPRGAVSSSALSAGRAVSAAMAQAGSAGGLSVPPSWVTAAPEIRLASAASELAAAAAAPVAAGEGLGTAFSQMALAGMGGSAVAGAVNNGRRDRTAVTPGRRITVPKPPADNTMAEMIAGIRQLGELRDSGLLTDEEFTDQKQRLLREVAEQDGVVGERRPAAVD